MIHESIDILSSDDGKDLLDGGIGDDILEPGFDNDGGTLTSGELEGS